jgi:site-specific DNA-cytosine methylase
MPADLPGTADLAWASFPCQDLSLAGAGAGLKGDRSGTFWPFWKLMKALTAKGRAPRMIVLENVCGAITSHGGKDFAAIGAALAGGGYRFGAVVMDAAHFVPQSRPRLFIVAVLASLPVPAALVAEGPDENWHSAALMVAHGKLSMRGSHPEGTDVSALRHLLKGEQTIRSDRGLFLAETWRLCPAICRFTSELFCANRLHSRPGLDKQRVQTNGRFSGSGLRYVGVQAAGNQSSSPEEADAVRDIVNECLAKEATWSDAQGREHLLTLNDILVIAPYNAQVFEILDRLPNARVGTVDKFQGQEAAIVIYSLATSSYSDAPRGMEFLYSLNRLNVATSRAKCLCILVASPEVFEAECRTPRQMQLANALCRFLEMAV